MPITSRPDERLTFDDFMRIPYDGLRHEIIDGVHYATPSPSVRHQLIGGRLYLAIGNHLVAHPEQGRVFYAPCDVVLSFVDVAEPDLLVVAGDQFGIVTEANVQGAPAIVIEVLSPNTRKVALVTKRNLFERGGVREYWIVDPKAEVLKVFKRATGGSFPRAIALSAGDTLTTPILPGLTIAIVDLFGPL
jgi:Uma2 family endonuclease